MPPFQGLPSTLPAAHTHQSACGACPRLDHPPVHRVRKHPMRQAPPRNACPPQSRLPPKDTRAASTPGTEHPARKQHRGTEPAARGTGTEPAARGRGSIPCALHLDSPPRTSTTVPAQCQHGTQVATPLTQLAAAAQELVSFVEAGTGRHYSRAWELLEDLFSHSDRHKFLSWCLSHLPPDSQAAAISQCLPSVCLPTPPSCGGR